MSQLNVLIFLMVQMCTVGITIRLTRNEKKIIFSITDYNLITENNDRNK